MKMTSETRLLLVMAVFVLLGGGALFFMNKSSEEAKPPTPATPPPKMTKATFDGFVSSATHVKGDPKAPLTIVEFADFQCPSCRRAFDTIVHDLGTRLPVRFVFHHYPLTNIHENAMAAAIAAEAAGKQDKFWPMYEKLFTGEKTELTTAFFDEQAKAIGLNMDQFHKDQNDPKVKEIVLADQKLAQDNNIQETPTFLILDNRKPDSEIQSVVGGPNLQTTLSTLLPGKVTAPSPGPAAPAP
jgi:protein-disulfide isomerase